MRKDSIPKRYYTLSEIEAMGIMSHTTAWRQVTAGKLRAIKVGKVIRISAESLEEFIEAHQVKAEA